MGSEAQVMQLLNLLEAAENEATTIETELDKFRWKQSIVIIDCYLWNFSGNLVVTQLKIVFFLLIFIYSVFYIEL